jgi:pimeloyl-ACP methyl ester carboxylesterase
MKLQKLIFAVLIIFSINKASANNVVIHSGTGQFVVDGGKGRKSAKITVFYYKPKSYQSDSPIIMVMPGAGRTGDKNRNRWIAAAEQYGLLVLSPAYAKKDYPKSANYNLARMVKGTADNYVTQPNAADWIFNDFDRIFDLAVQVTGSKQTQFDVFGHSAGAQLGHRLALFYPQSKANRILSANSGWYTAINFQRPFPYGLKNAPIAVKQLKQQLKQSFAKHLVVLLGQNDNEHETRGLLRNDEEPSRQGAHRLQRGKYFFSEAKRQAKALGYVFNWQIHVVPNVGHSSTKMSQAAAKYLYGANN